MYYKHPRMPHLPWSPGRTKDDRVLDSVDHFNGIQVVATIKMDGENTTLYRNHIHARSMDSRDHESRHWVKAFHNNIRIFIPYEWRICGENLYAKHSIHYKGLPSYFLVFSVWNENNMCLSWEETELFCSKLGLEMVQELFRGIWKPAMQEAMDKLSYIKGHEGYVIRSAGEFHYDDFEMNVAKYVRENHVQTDKHWMHSELVKNELRK